MEPSTVMVFTSSLPVGGPIVGDNHESDESENGGGEKPAAV